MANLLNTNFSEAELLQILGICPRTHLLPPAGSEAWDAVAANPVIQQWMTPLRERASVEATLAMPELTSDLYREFYRSGTRTNFESAYFERRRRLSRAAICALLEKNDSRWMESVRQKTREILSEYSWGLPAHINSLSGKDPVHIDLFAGETANLMAQLVDLFGSNLGPGVVEKIQWRVRNQFTENYLNRHEDFFWILSAGNWNAICHQGVLGSALTLEDENRLLVQLLLVAKKYLPIFLSGFGEDGGCSEGVGYWQFGFGWFCMLNEQLEIRTEGQLSLIEGDAKIPQIARFGTRVSLPGFHFANFADSPGSGTVNPSLLGYLASRLGDDHLYQHARHHYRHLAKTGLNLNAQRCDLFYLTRLFLHCPPDLATEDPPLQYEETYFKDLAVVVLHARDEKGNDWDFAAKGGHNNEQHNHNDCGSFIVNVNGVPLITEIGAPEYTKDYFRERRYEYLAARTLGHSLPIVNGCEQAAGVHYTAKVLTAEFEPDNAHFCVDITHCYPSSAGCGEVVRDFQWDKKKGRIQVKDYYELSKHESFESSIITDKQVTLGDKEAVIESDGVKLAIHPLQNTVFATVEDHEYKDQTGASKKVHRIILKPQNLEEQRSICYEIVKVD